MVRLVRWVVSVLLTAVVEEHEAARADPHGVGGDLALHALLAVAAVAEDPDDGIGHVAARLRRRLLDEDGVALSALRHAEHLAPLVPWEEAVAALEVAVDVNRPEPGWSELS